MQFETFRSPTHTRVQAQQWFDLRKRVPETVAWHDDKNITYAVEEIREEGDGVAVAGRFAGTFTNDMDLSFMGMGVIPATGAALDFPISHLQVSFDGDKISRMHSPDTGGDAGTAAFVRTLGGN